MPKSSLVAVLSGLLLASLVLMPSAASAAGGPVVTINPTVTGFNVAVAYSIDRPASRIAKQACWVRNPAKVLKKVACDRSPEPSSTATLTRFQKPLTVTKAGVNAFLVRFTLADGTTVLGGRSFTIKPGPAVRFSVTGLHDQTIRCDARACPGDWVQNVARHVAKITARDQYDNVATGYKGTVVFDGFGTTVSESTLTRGVGWFAVRPTGLQLNTYNQCEAGTPADATYEVALTVTDKADPGIHGCQMIRYELFFVLDPLPIFRIPVITPDGCTTGCVRDPTGTVVADTAAQPLQVLQVDTITLPNQAGTASVTIAGQTTLGLGFSQVLTITDTSVKGSELPQSSIDKCTGCTDTTRISVVLIDIPGGPVQTFAEPDPETSTVELFGVDGKDPFTGKLIELDPSGTTTKAAAPVCYTAFPPGGLDIIPCDGH